MHSSLAHPRPRPFTLLFALALVPATGCFDPRVVADTEDATDDDGATTDATDGSTTEAMTTVEPDSGSGEPPAVCGNGVVEGSELCDDGVNDGSYGGCNADCSAPGPFCGDGVLNGEEPCDDGDEVDGNGCNVDCVVSGSVLWTVTYDGPDHGIDAANGVTTDSMNNVIVSGTLSIGDEPSGWLRKYSPEGASDWTVDITSPMGPAGNGPVAALLDDDIVFGGSYGPSGPSQDAWVRRISTVGEPVWTQTHSSRQGGWDRVLAVDVDQDGNIYALFDEGQLPTEPPYRTFVRKFTPDGAELWTQFHDSGIRGRALSTDQNGRFVVAGTQDNSGTDEIWIQQSTSDGAEVWTRLVGAAESSHPTALSVSAEGEFAIAVEPSRRVIRFSASGQETTTLFPHPEAFALAIYSVHLEDNGNMVAGGTIVTRSDTAYGWVSKYDGSDSELWTNTQDGEFDTALSFDGVVTVTTDLSGNIIAAGRIHDSADSLSNVWTAKYAP